MLPKINSFIKKVYISYVATHIGYFKKEKPNSDCKPNSHLTDEAMDKIKKQVDHLMRTYEKDELRDEMIKLGCEWFLMGVMTGKNTGEIFPEDEIFGNW